MPTFIAYKDGQVIETVTGAVPAKINVSLYSLLRRHNFSSQSRLGFARQSCCLNTLIDRSCMSEVECIE